MTKKYVLTEPEIEVLQMINGDRPWERGAWVNATYEFLQDAGYILKDGFTTPTLSRKGKEYIEGKGYGV
jgi:hypothetical protein